LRIQAEQFLCMHGFAAPPLDPEQAIAAQKLRVAQLSLDDLLIKANLPPEDHLKIQAMLDARKRHIVFRLGLGQQKRNWGSLHEIAHDVLPWQRQLLYYCPLIFMPEHIQQQFEIEADIFAAEAFFFGESFKKYASEGNFGLATAIDLANRLYETSFHATFAHYVEQSDVPCCLIIWRIDSRQDDAWYPGDLSIVYYVRSRTFCGHLEPRQVLRDKELVDTILNNTTSNGIVKHDLYLNANNKEPIVIPAESFYNGYNVFTLFQQHDLIHKT